MQRVVINGGNITLELYRVVGLCAYPEADCEVQREVEGHVFCMADGNTSFFEVGCPSDSE